MLTTALGLLGTDTGKNLLGQLGSLFGGTKPNPNDWKGWDALDSQYNSPPGNQPYHWVINDGDSIENEAANIISYINGKANGLGNILTAANEVHNHSGTTALNNIYKKLQKAGRNDAVTLIKQMIEKPAAPNFNLGVNSTDIFIDAPPAVGVANPNDWLSDLMGWGNSNQNNNNQNNNNQQTTQQQQQKKDIIKYGFFAILAIVIYKLIKK